VKDQRRRHLTERSQFVAFSQHGREEYGSHRRGCASLCSNDCLIGRAVSMNGAGYVWAVQIDDLHSSPAG
jgi:hypothetical protein